MNNHFQDGASESLGKLLRTSRKSKKITQKELAKHMIISRQTISHWERGEAEPSLSDLRKLIKLLEIDIHQIFPN